MPSLETYHSFYLETAHAVARNFSKAQRLKVGAVIATTDSIISYGYNGTPRGHDNCCEQTLENGELQTLATVVHAEANAVLKLVGKTWGGDPLTLYCTDACCLACAVLIVQARHVYRFVYERPYRDPAGLDFLRASGIDVVHLPDLF